MKHLIVAAMLMVMTTPALAYDAQGNFGKFGAGNNSCGKWTSRREQGGNSSQTMVAWVSGYVTAYNAFISGVAEIADGSDIDGILAWIDNYCAANPLDDVEAAAYELVKFLKNR